MRDSERLRGTSWLRFLGVGFSFAAIVAVGWFLGQWADGRFGTAPWLTIAGTLVGVALAMFDLIKTTAALERRDDGKEE
jgi:F0F1-type ATP synthase assembly protein I